MDGSYLFSQKWSQSVIKTTLHLFLFVCVCARIKEKLKELTTHTGWKCEGYHVKYQFYCRDRWAFTWPHYAAEE